MKKVLKVLVCLLMVLCLALPLVMPAFALDACSISVNAKVGNKLYGSVVCNTGSYSLDYSWNVEDKNAVFESGKSYTVNLRISTSEETTDSSIPVTINGKGTTANRVSDEGATPVVFSCSYTANIAAPTTEKTTKKNDKETTKKKDKETTKKKDDEKTTATTEEETTVELVKHLAINIVFPSVAEKNKDLSLTLARISLEKVDNEAPRVSRVIALKEISIDEGINQNGIIGGFELRMEGKEGLPLKTEFGTIDFTVKTGFQDGQKLYVLQKHYFGSNEKKPTPSNGWNLVSETDEAMYIQKEAVVTDGAINLDSITMLSEFYISTESFLIEEEESTTAVPVETTTAAPAAPVDTEKGGIPKFVFVIIIVAALLIVAAVVALLLLKKAKKSADEEVPAESVPEVATPIAAVEPTPVSEPTPVAAPTPVAPAEMPKSEKAPKEKKGTLQRATPRQR